MPQKFLEVSSQPKKQKRPLRTVKKAVAQVKRKPYKRNARELAVQRESYRRKRILNPEYFWKKWKRNNHTQYKNNPEKRRKLELAAKTPEGKARKILRNAITRGKVIKPKKCCMCGKKCLLHGHHFDYSRPLWVIWVCPLCHSDIHRPIKVTTTAEKLFGIKGDNR